MKSLFYIAVLYTFLAPHPATGQYYRRPVSLLLGRRREGDIAAREPNRVYGSVRMSASPDSAAEILTRSSTSAPCWEVSATRLLI